MSVSTFKIAKLVANILMLVNYTYIQKKGLNTQRANGETIMGQVVVHMKEQIKNYLIVGSL